MTITVTNKSSRAFLLGGEMLLPHIPQDITEETKAVIEGSPYHDFFTYEITEDVPEGESSGQEQEPIPERQE